MAARKGRCTPLKLCSCGAEGKAEHMACQISGGADLAEWLVPLVAASTLSLRDSPAEFTLALAPIPTVSPGAHRTAPVWRVDSVPNRVLHHGVQCLGEAPLLAAHLVSLLDHLHSLRLRNRVQPTGPACPGRDPGVRRQVQP